MPLSRRLWIGLPLCLAACFGGGPVQRDFEPLRYDYLTPLRLNVADIVIADPPPPGPLDAMDPAPPALALQQMARDRLAAGGSLGRAVFVIDQAAITEAPGGLQGALAVHLDVLTSEGTRAGFAEARVSRQFTSGTEDTRAALYELTRLMMDDMNVEFEYQVRRSLRDWLQQATTAPPPAPVQREDLAPPAPGPRPGT